MRYWTSDIHFGHRNIIEYCQRPFESPEAMNEEIIRRWNETVGPNDDVMVLGDVALGKISETLPLVSQLQGNLFLVPGNHDRCWIGDKKGRDWEDKYESVGFTLMPEQMRLTIGDGIDEINVCHFPYEGESVEGRADRYTEYRIPDDFVSPLVHGHVHDAFLSRGRQYNVGMDVHDFRPIPDQKIIDWLATLKLTS